MNRRIRLALAYVAIALTLAISPSAVGIELVNPYPAVGPREISGSTPANRVLRTMQHHAVPPVTDILSQALQQVLSHALDIPVSVVRRPRAGGLDALRHVVEAARDSRTLLLGGSDTVVVQSLVKLDTRYDAVRDLVPIALVARMPLVLISAADVSSVLHFLDRSRSAGRSHLGSSGDLSTSQLAGALFERATQTPQVQVTFNGAHSAIRAVVAEQVHASFVPLPGVLHYAQNARFRILAIADSARHPALPDVPTLAEVGVLGPVICGWYGLFAPAATPPDAVKRLSALLIQEGWPKDQDNLLRQGLRPEHLSPSDFAQVIRADRDRWKAYLDDNAIR